MASFAPSSRLVELGRKIRTGQQTKVAEKYISSFSPDTLPYGTPTEELAKGAVAEYCRKNSVTKTIPETYCKQYVEVLRDAQQIGWYGGASDNNGVWADVQSAMGNNLTGFAANMARETRLMKANELYRAEKPNEPMSKENLRRMLFNTCDQKLTWLCYIPKDQKPYPHGFPQQDWKLVTRYQEMVDEGGYTEASQETFTHFVDTQRCAQTSQDDMRLAFNQSSIAALVTSRNKEGHKALLDTAILLALGPKGHIVEERNFTLALEYMEKEKVGGNVLASSIGENAEKKEESFRILTRQLLPFLHRDRDDMQWLHEYADMLADYIHIFIAATTPGQTYLQKLHALCSCASVTLRDVLVHKGGGFGVNDKRMKELLQYLRGHEEPARRRIAEFVAAKGEKEGTLVCFFSSAEDVCINRGLHMQIFGTPIENE